MPDVERRMLGRTGREVSVLGFGAMELRGGNHWKPRPLDEDVAARLLNDVLDAGVDVLDTSIDYGASEEIIGRAVGHRREEYFLASKCGCPVQPWTPGTPHGRAAHDFSRSNIIAGVEQSLRRLRTDHLDLVQLHMSPSLSVLQEHDALAALTDLREAGKVRFVGSSSTLPDLPDLLQLGAFDVFQIPYSALERHHEELISAAARAGAGVIVRGGVARGEPRSGEKPNEQWQLWSDAALDELTEGMSRTDFLLRFALSHPDLSTVIVGTANPEHFAQGVAAASRGGLPADVYLEAKRRLSAAREATPGASPLTAAAHVETTAAARYAKQLASHLGRKSGVHREADGERIVIGTGSCLLVVSDGALVLRARASDVAALDRVKDVIGRHLLRFGARDELVVAWSDDDASPAPVA